MRFRAGVTAASVALALSGMLNGCSGERTFHPSDAVLPLVVADPINAIPLGEIVDVVFEVVDTEPDLSVSVNTKIMTPPYRVESQLVVQAYVNQGFMAQGIWRDRQITVNGIVRAVDEKTGTIPLTYSFEVASISGPHKRRHRMVSSAHLKPHTPILVGGAPRDENGEYPAFTMAVWIRPHVPAQLDPLLQNP